MSRVERLLNLTSALLSTERLLAIDEIHEKIPGYPLDRASFRRQFERDKDALRQLGLPLTVAPISSMLTDNEVGYRIVAEEYFLRDPGLEPDELSALHLAAQTVRYGDRTRTAGLWKLGVTDVGADAVVTQAALPEAVALSSLFDAIAQRRSVEFVYKAERRCVGPRRLSFRNGHWYLSAFDFARSDDRSFRVDRIEGDVTLGDDAHDLPSETRVDVTSSFDAPWELGDSAAIPAVIRVDSPQSMWARRRLGEASVIAQHDDGSLSFRLRVRNVDAFRSFVLGFLDHAVIVEPPELRQELLAWIGAVS